MKNAIISLAVGCFIFLISPLFAQESAENCWDYSRLAANRSLEKAYMKRLPQDFQVAQLDFSALKSELLKATTLRDDESEKDPLILTLPTPGGAFLEYVVFENSVISPKVKDLYTIKTYAGYAKNSAHVKIRCDISDVGFHAFVFHGSNSFVIEPYQKGDNKTHLIYSRDKISSTPVRCSFKHQDHRHGNSENLNFARSAPTELREFELALVATGEYSEQFGGNPVSSTTVLNSFASAVNMMNPIYERDLGVTFSLVSTADLVFEDPDTDPFDPFDDQGVLIEQNQTECDAALGSANYDVGHLLVWANIGGLASAGVVCDNSFKAEGFSGSDDSFMTLFVDYACHEIGHQFDASHNFVSDECETSEPGFRLEPGEGSSIMAYAGVCPEPANYQNNSDPYFHSASINSMNAYIAANGGCATTSSPGSGNSAAPVPNAQSNITIPTETPFVLVGSATDGNDPQNQLTYLWEQNDGNGPVATGAPNCSSSNQPLFRYRDPVSANFRVFPPMSAVLAGNNNGVTWEKLPCGARTMNFNLIARDNNSNWGRTGNDQMVVTVANTGPFAVTSPNGGEDWNAGSLQPVTWSENGTSAHCATVDILFSADNGNTFTTIASSVANNGSQVITVPENLTSTARILIQCSVGGDFRSASTFFDVSNGAFAVQMALPIQLETFEVDRYEEDQVEISWVTTSEISSSHVEVERSRDGQNFQKIAQVGSAGGADTRQEYSTIDKSPFEGLNYYRLKQIDLDGTFEYSPARSIQFFGTADEIEIYPNPARDLMTIKIPDSYLNSSIELMSQLGKTVRTLKDSQRELNVSELPPGIYYLQVTSNKPVFVKKVIVGR